VFDYCIFSNKLDLFQANCSFKNKPYFKSMTEQRKVLQYQCNQS